MAGMWNALSISAGGLAASAAQLTSAASKLVTAFTGPSTPPAPATPAPVPSSTPASRPLASATAVAAQNDTPASWMVEILSAKYAYRANLDALKTADQLAQKTIDTIG
ncbi:MAG: hypothetical protein KGO02_05010 [Alphaproteobacteria bacterium]|nr:hypothetical protein [Alphaproteobacteria bacterium]